MVPGVSGMVGHTTTNDHAVAGNPLATSVTEVDATGGATPSTVTTVVDLLGRVREYEDAWGNLTTTSYDQVGRTTQVDSPVGVETMTYDANGNPGPTVLDGVTLATPHYDSAGRLDWVAYANGVTSDPVVRDELGRETGSTWRRISDSTVLATESSTLTLGGKLVELSTDGNDPRPGGPNYVYDRAGRLTEAWTTTRDAAGTIGSQHTAYGFGPAAGSCAAGTQANAGKNTNRTSQAVGDGPGAVTTTYCYDAADRLVSTSEAGVGTIAYDAHGNTTSVWGETRSYDASDRHVATSKAGVTVSYRRDASGRIISRSSSAAGGSEQRYGFTGESDSPDLTLDATGAVVERTIGLAGGATLTKRTGSEAWSLPNLHGDSTVVTDGAGVFAGPSRTYDPFGATTGQPLVDNSDGLADYAWLGQYQRLTEHEAGFAQTIEMGARQYDPVLGRFLEVDPVEGGSANDYDYVNADPVNGQDLDGLCKAGNPFSPCGVKRWRGRWRYKAATYPSYGLGPKGVPWKNQVRWRRRVTRYGGSGLVMKWHEYEASSSPTGTWCRGSCSSFRLNTRWTYIGDRYKRFYQNGRAISAKTFYRKRNKWYRDNSWL